MISDVGHFFMSLMAIGMSSLENAFLSLPLIFWLGCLCFDIELYKFYVLEVNSLLDIPFANIFFHSIDCLFVFVDAFLCFAKAF